MAFTRFFVSTIMGVALLSASAVWAADASVISFTASPTAVSNNYPVALIWEVSGNGANIEFKCSAGVTVKTYEGGTIPCGSKLTAGTSLGNVGSGGYAITNVSGSTQVVTVTLYPKDANGVEYTAGAKSVTLTVGTALQPLTEFTASTDSPTSGSPVTFTWKSTDVGAVNMMFPCVSGITWKSSDSTVPISCGKVAFSTDLGQSGSVTLTPTNSTNSRMAVNVLLLPRAATNVYDFAHTLERKLIVSEQYIAPTPIGLSFNASVAQVVPKVPFTLSWAVQNATTSNIQFTCNFNLTVEYVSNSGTTKLPCGRHAFTPPLGAEGSMTIVVSNNSPLHQVLSAFLLPISESGISSTINAKAVYLSVMPDGTPTTTVVKPAVSPTTSAATTPANTTPTSNTSGQVGTNPFGQFTYALELGSRGTAVTILQKFLAQNADIYPEGLVTGYFGGLSDKAVKRFQEKYGIAGPGDAGYGYVGPKTRAKLNTLITP